MDLIAILEARVRTLKPGAYTTGLNAVVQHIRAATAHLERGDKEQDFTAYTDTIYRCNQAFEGSLKECYRALTGKDPGRVRPYDIEQYLEREDVLRERILAQITTYRRNWRNPSTHDYKLDFDASEALLAVASIYAVAIALIDQILVAFGQKEGYQGVVAQDRAKPLADRVFNAFSNFKLDVSEGIATGALKEREILGALAGHMKAALPDLQVQVEPRVDSDGRFERPDLLLTGDSIKIVVELKAGRMLRPSQLAQTGLAQLQRYVVASNATIGFLVILSEAGGIFRTQEQSRVVFRNGVEAAVLGPSGTRHAVEQAVATVGATLRG